MLHQAAQHPPSLLSRASSALAQATQAMQAMRRRSQSLAGLASAARLWQAARSRGRCSCRSSRRRSRLPRHQQQQQLGSRQATSLPVAQAQAQASSRQAVRPGAVSHSCLTRRAGPGSSRRSSSSSSSSRDSSRRRSSRGTVGRPSLRQALSRQQQWARASQQRSTLPSLQVPHPTCCTTCSASWGLSTSPARHGASRRRGPSHSPQHRSPASRPCSTLHSQRTHSSSRRGRRSRHSRHSSSSSSSSRRRPGCCQPVPPCWHLPWSQASCCRSRQATQRLCQRHAPARSLCCT
jgi:hypothetical protein